MRETTGRIVISVSLLVAAAICTSVAAAGSIVDPGGGINDIVADPVRNDLYVSLDTGEIVTINMTGGGSIARRASTGAP